MYRNQWVGHALKNVIELHPSQNTSAVVLLKMLRLSLKPKSLRNFKTTRIYFKIEYGPNSGNAKSLWAFTKLSFASCCKKLIENISAVSIAKTKLRLTWMENEQLRGYKNVPLHDNTAVNMTFRPIMGL